MKDPDAMYDCVRESVKEWAKEKNLAEDETIALVEIKLEKELEKMDRWFEYQEYLSVEFDTDDMTATVCENRS